MLMSDVSVFASSIDQLWAHLNAELVPTFSRYREWIADLPVEVKADKTLLTEADIAVQNSIIEAIRAMEPSAVVIAEEDERADVRTEVLQASGRVWVIDPIDGTAEFVRGDRIEFCSVVCLLEDWQPSAAFVLAPELGPGPYTGPDYRRRCEQACGGQRCSRIAAGASRGFEVAFAHAG